nr:MAG: putative movement protein [Tombusviridae sp.]
MSIVSLDGEFAFTPYTRTSSLVHLSHKTKRGHVQLGPSTFSQKWKVPKDGFYTPTDVRLVVTPHISERAGVMATVKLVDESDMSPSRVLYQSKEFNLGHGLTMEGSQLPFCLPVGEYPIAFEVTVSRSQFADTRTMFTTSLEWRMMWSATPLSRVKSVFAEAHQPVLDANPSFRHLKIKDKGTKSSGPRAAKALGGSEQLLLSDGGTTLGLVTESCVGSEKSKPSKADRAGPVSGRQ